MLFLLTSYFSLLALTSGCGYRTIGKLEIPPDIQTIAVPVFYNQTFEPILEKSITAAVKNEFLTNGRLKVVNDPDLADLVLRGTILSYGLTPLSFDQNKSVVLEYRIHIRIRVLLEDSHTRNVLLEESAMEAIAEYLVHPDTSAARVAQDQAIEEASRLFAENLVSRILEGTE